MRAYQLTIPAENKPGVLAKVTSALAREKIDIRATTISSFGDHGFFNLIVDDVERAEKVLKKERIKVELKEVIAVLMKDQPGGLDKLVQILSAAQINIENAYGFVIESHRDAVFILDVKNPAQAKELLKKEKFSTLSAEALAAIEPFHFMKY